MSCCLDRLGVCFSAAAASRPATGAGAFHRSINRLPGTNKFAVVLAMPQGAAGAGVFRPNTGRQQRPMPRDQFVSRWVLTPVVTESSQQSARLWGHLSRLGACCCSSTVGLDRGLSCLLTCLQPGRPRQHMGSQRLEAVVGELTGCQNFAAGIGR